MKKRKIATNIPDDILMKAMELSGLNQTSAIVEGLKELIRKEKIKRLINMRGKFSFEYDPDLSRNR